jgi:DNA adenine methylase
MASRRERDIVQSKVTPSHPETVNGRAGEEKWRPLTAPFGYYGCKQRLSSRIVADLPPHNAWVEAFCGSAAVTLAKKPAPIEVINDIHGEITNFFEQLRDHGKQMQESIRLTPYARKELEKARSDKTSAGKMERARRFFVAAMMSINGSFGEDEGGFSFSNSYTRRGMEARVSRWTSMPDHLALVAERLRRVRIENRDALKLFKGFTSRPATLVYFDPPYFAKRRQGYDYDQPTVEFHTKLLEAVVKAKCMVLLSGYDNQLYNKYLHASGGWHKRTLATTTRGHNGQNFAREEVLWSNKAYQQAQASNRVPIHLSAQERRYKKINPER